MFSQVGMSSSLNKIIRFRNELIHSGLIAIPPNERFKLFETLMDIIREYMFRIIDFSGTFRGYSPGKFTTIWQINLMSETTFEITQSFWLLKTPSKTKNKIKLSTALVYQL